MGGFVGMRIAARRPELLRSLVLLDTSAAAEPDKNVPQYRAMNAVVRAGAKRFLVDRVMKILFGTTFLSDPSRASDRERWKQHLIRLPSSSWRAVNGVIERESILGELGRIRAPTLILVGDEDVATVPEKSEEIQRGIPGSRLVRIPRAGHSSTVEEPEAVTAEIRAFLHAL